MQFLKVVTAVTVLVFAIFSHTARADIKTNAECAAISTYAGLQPEAESFVNEMMVSGGRDSIDASYYYGYAMGYLYNMFLNEGYETEAQVQVAALTLYGMKCQRG